MIAQNCPKCGSNRIRHGYRPTHILWKFIFRHNLLCKQCNWEFIGFALPGIISKKNKKEDTVAKPKYVSHPTFSTYPESKLKETESLFERHSIKIENNSPPQDLVTEIENISPPQELELELENISQPEEFELEIENIPQILEFEPVSFQNDSIEKESESGNLKQVRQQHRVKKRVRIKKYRSSIKLI